MALVALLMVALVVMLLAVWLEHRAWLARDAREQAAYSRDSGQQAPPRVRHLHVVRRDDDRKAG